MSTATASSSVLVVSYRPGDWLRPCLQSITTQADEVILVDNGSADGEAGVIGEEAGVRVLRLPTNVGFAGGVNAGLASASADLVGLLNDDATADPGWLDVAADVLADPDIAAVAPKILFSGAWAEIGLDKEPHWAPGDHRPLGTPITSLTVNGTERLADAIGGIHELEPGDDPIASKRWSNGLDPVHVPVSSVSSEDVEIRVNGRVVEVVRIGSVVNNAGSYLAARGFGGDYGFETADRGQFDTPADRFAVTGAAMVASRATFDRIGPLAEDFFAYYEDLDWSWRARMAGLRIHYEPAATVRHRRSATSGARTTPLLELLGTRNRLLCLIRNAPLGLAYREVSAGLVANRPPRLRQSLAAHVPRALRARAQLARRSRLRSAEVLADWQGRDNSWGLASQMPGAAAPGPGRNGW
ncbi:MAG: glycosyltransferase family 2 protein [Actinomycetota bacterium]|nr:glycosyltransferase family 2 protein [Actinomycetota bacterium]